MRGSRKDFTSFAYSFFGGGGTFAVKIFARGSDSDTMLSGIYTSTTWGAQNPGVVFGPLSTPLRQSEGSLRHARSLDTLLKLHEIRPRAM